MTSTYDSTGITLDRYADILTDLEDAAKATWGDGVNLDDDGLIGHFNSNLSLLIDEINEIIQDIYDATSVNNASGVRIDNLLELIGLERQAAAYTTVTLTLTAGGATTVPQGTRYATATDIIFETDTALVFAAAGTDTVAATCDTVGAFSVGAAEVTVIKDAVYKITGCTNVSAATPGRAQETDTEFKERHTTAVQTTGEQSISDVYSAVAALTGVSAVYCYDNDTTAGVLVNGYTVPAHSIHVSTVGGTAADIGAAIANNKAAGVGTAGGSSVTVYNSTTSQAKTIYYDTATSKRLYAIVNISVVTGVFPSNGDALIKTSLSDHFDDFDIAEDVEYTLLYKAIYDACSGFSVSSLLIEDVTPPTASADITVDYDEIAALAEADITINHV